jgi:hypothetical protein
MKLLKCKLCRGECEIIGGFSAISKIIKCTKCGYSNANEEVKTPEVFVIRKKIKDSS